MTLDRPQTPTPPSTWVTRFAHLVTKGPVLDLACGGGRHGRFFLRAGYQVLFVDRDVSRLADLRDNPAAQVMQYDLENDSPWPFERDRFGAVVVVNYLHRPLFPHLAESLQKGGVLIYQTFALGNEKYGRPSNPDFLLKENELLERFGQKLQVVDFEQGYQPDPERVIQSICALKT